MVIASCHLCGKEESDELKLLRCGGCRSVCYCSKECQKKDWKTQHKAVCKQLSVGDAKQPMHSDHLETALDLKNRVQKALQDCPKELRRFFTLFFESNPKASDHSETVSHMKRLMLKQTRCNRQVTLFRSLSILIGMPTKMIKLPTSPLKIALDCRVDPSVISSRAVDSRDQDRHHCTGSR